MTHTIDLDDLLTNEAAARLLGIKPNTLEMWRYLGKGPPFLKLGDVPQSPVRYLRSAVMAWLAERSYRNTSEATAAMRVAPVKVAPGAIPGPWTNGKRNVNQSGGASE